MSSSDTRQMVDTHRITSSLGRGNAQRGGTLTAGQVLQQRYQILGIVGMGGMSAVYQSRDLRFPNVTKLAAVKEMVNVAPDPQLRALAIQNFEREANILATLSHPCIPKVYDYFSEHNRSYLVIEFIDGTDLEAYMVQNEGLISPDLVLDWTLQLCDVIIYLHTYEPPIVFRDMKPSNVMLDKHGKIRLVDFGIAKLFQAGQKGTMIGTEGYSPPEQYRGVASPRGDIYALGATLHHLLTKQDPRLEPPFSFHDRPILKANPNIPEALVSIVMRALEYEPENRWASVADMQRALLSLRGGKEERTFRETAGTVTIGSGGDVEAVWSFACEDEVRSTPTFYEDILYIGAYDNNLYALDAKTGKFIWKYPTEGGLASSPCIWEDRVMVGSEDKLMYTIHRTSGRIIWTFPTQGKIRSSPYVYFGHVLFGSDDAHLYAVNLQSGRVTWKFATSGAVRCRPAVQNDTVYFGSADGNVYALDVSGKSRWQFSCRRGVTSSPCVSGGLVFVGSDDYQVYAIDARSGWAVWRFRTGKPVVSSPAVADELVYIGSADHNLYALNAQSGRQIWKFETEGQITSSPAVAGEAVYIGSVDGYVYSIDAKSGKLRWRFKTNGPVTSSPTLANDMLYIGSSDRHVYALAT